ncbi:MAG: LLM class F420-dependent oxidoreductase [Dehalococcoidia bacterium]
MKLGIHLANFSWVDDMSAFAGKLDEIVADAEGVGFDRLSVMDHYFQIPGVGPHDTEMFEAYNILGYIAARTSRIKLGVLATGVTYRNPGYLVKQVTGLDVLSGGRAWLGIGAAWYEREHHGLGFEFPPLRERFERLDEVLQIANQMWSENDGAFRGQYYQLEETLCVPQPLQQPRPPILVAGSGEKKTLRLVARYGDACNVRGDSPEEVRRRFEILADHCEAEGRNYDEIHRTITLRMDPGASGERVPELVDTIGRFAEAGVQTTIGTIANVQDPGVLRAMSDVIAQVADL